MRDCVLCDRLMEEVSAALTRYSTAVADCESRVINDADETRAAKLRRLVGARAAERDEAIDRYRIHALTHIETDY